MEGPEEKPKKEAQIRTMKSDIAEFLKETKPSLISIITKEAERNIETTGQPQRAVNLKKIILIGAIAAVALAGGYFLYSSFISVSEKIPAVSKPVPPAPLFATEKSRTANLKPNDGAGLRSALVDSASEGERSGTMKRLLFRVLDLSAGEHFMTTAEFLKNLDILPPDNISNFFSKNFTAAIYYQNDGPRFVFATAVSDPDRTLAGMLNWEVSLQRDIIPFFLREQLPTKLIQFEDRTSNNIDWRYLKLDDTKDIGIAYTVFRAKNYLIITTSKESIETIISRLLSGGIL